MNGTSKSVRFSVAVQAIKKILDENLGESFSIRKEIRLKNELLCEYVEKYHTDYQAFIKQPGVFYSIPSEMFIDYKQICLKKFVKLQNSMVTHHWPDKYYTNLLACYILVGIKDIVQSAYRYYFFFKC